MKPSALVVFFRIGSILAWVVFGITILAISALMIFIAMRAAGDMKPSEIDATYRELVLPLPAIPEQLLPYFRAAETPVKPSFAFDPLAKHMIDPYSASLVLLLDINDEHPRPDVLDRIWRLLIILWKFDIDQQREIFVKLYPVTPRCGNFLDSAEQIFGVPLETLTADQIALLMSPFRIGSLSGNPISRVEGERDRLLTAFAQNELITKDELELFKSQPINPEILRDDCLSPPKY